jgi:hypothetical protein
MLGLGYLGVKVGRVGREVLTASEFILGAGTVRPSWILGFAGVCLLTGHARSWVSGCQSGQSRQRGFDRV